MYQANFGVVQVVKRTLELAYISWVGNKSYYYFFSFSDVTGLDKENLDKLHKQNSTYVSLCRNVVNNEIKKIQLGWIVSYIESVCDIETDRSNNKLKRSKDITLFIQTLFTQSTSVKY